MKGRQISNGEGMIIVVVLFRRCAGADRDGRVGRAARTGQSGWVDAIWSFAVGVVGAAAALAPIAGR